MEPDFSEWKTMFFPKGPSGSMLDRSGPWGSLHFPLSMVVNNAMSQVRGGLPRWGDVMGFLSAAIFRVGGEHGGTKLPGHCCRHAEFLGGLEALDLRRWSFDGLLPRNLLNLQTTLKREVTRYLGQ